MHCEYIDVVMSRVSAVMVVVVVGRTTVFRTGPEAAEMQHFGT
jgi:hypothetical protein